MGSLAQCRWERFCKLRLFQFRVTFLLVLTAICACATLVSGQTFTLLHTFNGKDGDAPTGRLLRDTMGNLYGTTNGGGTYQLGTVFKLNLDGTETVLHNFAGSPDGEYPDAKNLVVDRSGNLYSATSGGGVFGGGTVFRVTSNGNEVVVHSFGGPSDGDEPIGELALDGEGNLYGTTFEGDYPALYGTVFEIDRNGMETILHGFLQQPDGLNPIGGIIRDLDGNLYGTTVFGGDDQECYLGCGTVFKVDSQGNETVLHSFVYDQGELPQGPLIRDALGNLYGTVLGLAFKLDTSGQVTFSSDIHDSEARLTGDGKGNLYGTSIDGGSGNCVGGCGTVFRLDKTGTVTVLYSFTGGADGAYPDGGVVRDSNGNLYGTAAERGDASCDPPYGCGTIFRITP